MARKLRLVLALGSRLALLARTSWVAHLTHPAIAVAGHEFSGRDLILIGGGLFLAHRGRPRGSTHEWGTSTARPRRGLPGIVLPVAVLDRVLSLDSVITAVGMVGRLPAMIAAVVIAMAVMLLASGLTADLVDRRPTVKMLVLSFLLMIGMMWVADGFGVYVPTGYVYAAIGFSAGVEGLNQIASRRAQTGRYTEQLDDGRLRQPGRSDSA